MLQREFRAMGSRILALLDCEVSDPAADQINLLPTWFEEWEQALSRFRIDSELTRLNSASGSESRVSQTLWDVLQQSIEAEALTDGLVNPLVLEAMLDAGYDRTFDLIEAGYFTAPPLSAGPRLRTMIEPLPPVSSIAMDEATRSIRLPEGMGLDFGGVAKGWAAHRAAHRLAGAGRPALVSAGGDVQVSGPLSSGEPWRIGVEDPAQRDRYLEMIYLERGGVATSGKDHRHWQHNGFSRHHVIDPRTLEPALTDVMAATIVAADVMRAEALAKAVLIAGGDAGLQLLDQQPDAEGILVLVDGRLRYSRNIGDYL